jgi:carnitine O-palmitoyltransferase 2
LTKEDLEVERKAAQDFSQTQGVVLQNELEKYADQLDTSYISPFWTEMYMKGRWSLAVHSNPGTLSSSRAFESSASWPAGKPPSIQVQRAAQCVRATLDFLKSIEEETLEPDEFRGAPLDMYPYTLMFGTTRAPMKFRDVWVRAPNSRHITVLRSGNFFKVEVLDDKRRPLSATSIAKLLSQVMASSAKSNTPNLAALTTLDRDTWASAYVDLKSSSGEALNAIGGSLFHLALDDKEDTESNRNGLVRSCLHGSGKNRWFDQSFTLIVDSNGSVGSSFEHSWGDGLSMVRWSNMMHKQISNWKVEDFGTEGSLNNSLVKKLEFQGVSPSVLKTCNDALVGFEKLIKELGLETRIFSDFGVKQLKSWKASPDGCFQQAVQLAYRRMTGKTVATYESCSTQMFLGGRTETIRSATPESSAFVGEMLDCLSEGEVARGRLLRIAVSKHSELATEAATGHGFDRHLFALTKLAETKRLPLPDVLKGKGYTLLQSNILSTSTVSQEYVEQAAFGPVVSNGLGICYHFFPDRIHFSVTSYGGDAAEFSNMLENALRDVGRLLQRQV